ncbi:MAG: SDR family NAD(P)-dependent oxidoreductase [Candidatus Neomarinimicrobiota bacterium]|jgi:UDP-glucuronate 4-epimerase|uniref:NAD-dependent epimerase/dehydratase domain-containing protein n=1 Tax=marine metagenome TaxID=408172 RepID=A0A381Z2I7_9ZZZZ|nr:SDR family NAD(P)-dependent oxidoreductase [Candidatus Neomarinimicrobiota bacterium]
MLITGVAGFIGYHLAKRLLEEGYDLIGLDNLNNYYDPQLKKDRLAQLINYPNFEFIKIDFTDQEKTRSFFMKQSFEQVIHLGAQAGVRYSLENPQAYIDTNLTGFLNILEGCRHNNISRVIYASSSSVYGNNSKSPFSENDQVRQPISLYGVSKLANEAMAHTYAHLYGMQMIGLRFFTVYGPWGRPDMALFLFTKYILNRKPIQVFNQGKHTRSFTYIGDIIESIFQLIIIEKDTIKFQKNEIFNIGGSEPVKLMRFIKIIENTLGLEANIEYLPLQPGDVKKTNSDNQKLESIIDYSPQIDIKTGIKHFIEWYKEYYNIS